MSIEYIPGLEVGKKINLDELPSRRFEKKARRLETYVPMLKEQLAAMASRLNAEHGQLFTDAGQVRMDGQSAGADQAVVDKKEETWAAEKMKDRATWRADRENGAPAIAEAALTLLFDRILKEDFIIVRASAYDDYKNGADHLIIDKRTGAVICGLDDVLGHEGDDGGQKKSALLEERLAGGGMSVRYGLVSQGGRVERRELRNIPLFYFSLSKEELRLILDGLESGNLNGDAKQVFAKLVGSLAGQTSSYQTHADLPGQLAANLERFAPSLEKMLNYAKTE